MQVYVKQKRDEAGRYGRLFIFWEGRGYRREFLRRRGRQSERARVARHERRSRERKRERERQRTIDREGERKRRRRRARARKKETERTGKS